MEKANQLVRERRSIQQAMEAFDSGGRILAITVGQPPPEGIPFPTGPMVSTQHIDYPPQMVDAIKEAFTTRQGQISEELAKLGLTGV